MQPPKQRVLASFLAPELTAMCQAAANRHTHKARRVLLTHTITHCAVGSKRQARATVN